MKNKFWMIAETIMLMAWIITTFIFLNAVFNKETKCMANPLVFGSKVLSDKNNASFTCKCQFSNSPDYVIFVDSKHWEYKKGVYDLDLNFTGGSYEKEKI